MTTKTFSLTSFAGLFALALGFSLSTEQSPRDGSLRVSINGSSGIERAELVRGSLTISGLDGSFQTRVGLTEAADGNAIQISLPAGVYGVQWHAAEPFERSEAPRVEFVAPLRSTRLVVVAAERVSALDVTIPSDAELDTHAAQSAPTLGATLALR